MALRQAVSFIGLGNWSTRKKNTDLLEVTVYKDVTLSYELKIYRT